MGSRRLTFLAKAPVPFHRPILDVLAAHVDLSVLYLADKRSQDFFSERSHHLAARTIQTLPLYVGDPERAPRWPLRLGAELERERPQVVLLHSWDPAMWPAIFWARRHGVRTVMWVESTRWSGRSRSELADALRRQVVRHVDAFVANGTEARDYAVDLGAPPDSIATPLYPIASAKEATDDGRQRHDDSASEPGRLNVLFVGRLIRRKRASDVVIASSKAAARQGLRPYVRIVGTGPERESLTNLTKDVSIDVDLAGWREGSELNDDYNWADVVVVPSEREVWGLVVNEALDRGCYVLASTEVGAAHDLVTDAIVGSIYPVGATDRLATLLCSVASDIDLSAEGRRTRRAFVRSTSPGAFDPAIFARAVVSAGFPSGGP